MLVTALLEHGYVPTRDEEVAKEIARDWLAGLAEFPIEVVADCKRQWVFENENAPKLATFRTLCRGEAERRSPVARLPQPRRQPRDERELLLALSLDLHRHNRLVEGRDDIDLQTCRDRARQRYTAIREAQPGITIAEAYCQLSRAADAG